MMKFRSRVVVLVLLAVCDGSIGDVGVGPDGPGPGPRGEDLERGVIEGGGHATNLASYGPDGAKS